MPIQHVVAFKFKPAATADQLADVARAFVALQHQCVRPAPSAGERYIVRLVGGRQDSAEGADQGLQHVYLVEFENDADRAYYVDADPAHGAFKALVGPLVDSVVVLDFTEGVF